MRDALNATGRSIYFSITQQFGRCNARADGQPGCATGGDSPGAVPSWNPSPENGHVPLVKDPPHLSMECFQGAFTPLPWRRQGLHPADLANSWLVEYCNNGPRFGSTLGPGGSLLSQLDSQADWTLPELAAPGGLNDMDMLEVCYPEWMLGGKPDVEGWKAEFALWSCWRARSFWATTSGQCQRSALPSSPTLRFWQSTKTLRSSRTACSGSPCRACCTARTTCSRSSRAQ